MTREEALKLYKTKMAVVEELEAQIKQLDEKRWEIKNAAEKIFVDNQLYTPIAELEALGNRRLNRVVIYYIPEDHEDVLYESLDGDILEVEKGRLYFSDYWEGIVEWDEEEQSYCWIKNGTYIKIHILGYSDLRESVWQRSKV